jgi:hypothetical protein
MILNTKDTRGTKVFIGQIYHKEVKVELKFRAVFGAGCCAKIWAGFLCYFNLRPSVSRERKNDGQTVAGLLYNFGG